MMSDIELKTLLILAEAAGVGTVPAAVALIGRSILSSASAAIRHSLLASSLTVVLCLPFLCILLSKTPVSTIGIKVPLAAAAMNNSSQIKGETQMLGYSSDDTISSHAGAENHSNLVQRYSFAPTPSAIPAAVNSISTVVCCAPYLLALWAAGVLVCFSQMIFSAYKLRREYRLSEPASERVQEISWIATRILNIPKPVSVRQCCADGDVIVPITWGFFNPKILLPANSESWSDANICAALMHELAHVKRSDWAVQMLAQAACVLHWFNPLVWKSAADLRFESETATDDVVVSIGLSPTRYAQSLVDVARTMQNGRCRSLAAVAMASPCDINKRVLAILDSKQDRRPLNRATAVCTLAALMTIAAPFCAVRVEAQQAVPGAQEQAAPTPPATPQPVQSTGKESDISILREETVKPGKRDGDRPNSVVVMVDSNGKELTPEEKKQIEILKAQMGTVSKSMLADKKLHIVLEETAKDLAEHHQEIDSDLTKSLSQLGPLISKSVQISLQEDAPEIKKAEHLASIDARPQISHATSQALIELDKQLGDQNASADKHQRIIIQDNGDSDKSFELLSKKIEQDALRIKASAVSGRSDDTAEKQLADDAGEIALKAIQKASQSGN